MQAGYRLYQSIACLRFRTGGTGSQAVSAGDIFTKVVEHLRSLVSGRRFLGGQDAAALAGDDALFHAPPHSGIRVCAQSLRVDRVAFDPCFPNISYALVDLPPVI